jgi:hypothetical protein
MRIAIAALLFVAAALPAPLPAAGRAVAGRDRAVVVPPAGAVVEPYRNAGYELRFVGGGIEIHVDLEPLASRSPFVLPPGPPASALASRARAAAAGATTVYDASVAVLGWVRGNVRYELDRRQSQEPAAVLARGSAYCTGTARLAAAMLTALGIEAREVPGYVLEDLPSGPRAGFHRWIELRLPDRGWVFADPLATALYVPASYVRLAADRLEELPGSGRMLERDDRIEEIDLAAAAATGLRVRRNDEQRVAAALIVRVDGTSSGRATLANGQLRAVTPLVDGVGRFLGIEPGSYRLEVEADGRVQARKDVVFRAPVLAEVTIPAGEVTQASGGGR